jgi:hypothetical protein
MVRVSLESNNEPAPMGCQTDFFSTAAGVGDTALAFSASPGSGTTRIGSEATAEIADSRGDIALE